MGRVTSFSIDVPNHAHMRFEDLSTEKQAELFCLAGAQSMLIVREKVLIKGLKKRKYRIVGGWDDTR